MKTSKQQQFFFSWTMRYFGECSSQQLTIVLQRGGCKSPVPGATATGEETSLASVPICDVFFHGSLLHSGLPQVDNATSNERIRICFSDAASGGEKLLSVEGTSSASFYFCEQVSSNISGFSQQLDSCEALRRNTPFDDHTEVFARWMTVPRLTLVLFAVGLIGTVLPAVPGATIILAAAVIHRIIARPGEKHRLGQLGRSCFC
jgi:hypothetical protein